MISLREYAEKNKVTYETIRKKVTRLEREGLLEGHVENINGTRYIDDEAIELLNQTRKKMLVIEYADGLQNGLDEANDTIRSLQADKIDLLEKINEANKRLLALSDEVNKLKVEQAKLESDNKLLLEDSERAKAESEKVRADLKTVTEAKAQSDLLLRQAEGDKARLQGEVVSKAQEIEEHKKEISERDQEIQEQAEELASYHKTIFGLYRKDKREG